jgi:hypothetical protein
MNGGPNRIDPTAAPVRISTNLSIDRQTPKSDFGDRVKAGLDQTAGAVASGAAVAAPFVPGGAIVSAAISSVTTMSGPSGGVATQYSGVTAVPAPVGAGGSPGTLNTTLGTPGAVPAAGGAPSILPGNVSSGTMGGFASDLDAMRMTNLQLMSAQMAMQRENQVFSTVSNVLKVRHDTVKNTIQNVR